jgi:non-specific serine/threonine protein kinase
VERLDAAGEREILHARHRDWYLALATQADAEFNGPRQAHWIQVLEREQDNARSALRWSLDHGAVEHALRLATALAYFWEIRGHLFRAEARRWLDEALADASAHVDPRVRARALYWAGTFASEQYDFARAEAYLAENQQFCERVEDWRGLAAALLGLGHIAYSRGQYSAATTLLDRSVALSRKLDDQASVGVALRWLAATARATGNAAQAVQLATESLGCCRAAGDSHQAGHVLDHIGEAECDRLELQRAAHAHAEAVKLLQAAGCEEGVTTSLSRQARLARASGDASRALELALAALRGFQVLGHRRDLPPNLELVGELVVGDTPRVSAFLLGAAEACRENMSAALVPVDRPMHATAVAAARRALGEAIFGQTWQAGRDAPVDQAISEALKCERRASSAPSAKFALTPREVEVAVLVGRGLSNREIAERLVVSERTAEAHISNALSKLGMRSRAQLAIWAAEQGLLKTPAS